MAKVRVQVSMLRDPIEVDEGEIPGLRSQGILVGVAGETAEQEHPGTGTEMTAVEHPADGTLSPAVSGDGAPAGATAGRKPRRTDGE